MMLAGRSDGIVDLNLKSIAGEWIKIASLCTKLAVLPEPGGLFDQQPIHLDRLLIVYDEQEQAERMERERQQAEANIASQIGH